MLNSVIEGLVVCGNRKESRKEEIKRIKKVWGKGGNKGTKGERMREKLTEKENKEKGFVSVRVRRLLGTVERGLYSLSKRR